MDADVEIRAARPSDARAFHAFWTAIVAEGRFVRTEEVRERCRSVFRKRFRERSDQEVHLLAFGGSRLVGHVTVQTRGASGDPARGSLAIAVAAGARPRDRTAADGRGDRVVDPRRYREARAVRLPAQRRGDRPLPRFGFVEEGRLARHSRKSYGDEDEILMAAWIGGATRERARAGAGMSERTIRVGMLGCGTVGAAVIRLLHEHADDIARRAGVARRGRRGSRCATSGATGTSRSPPTRSPTDPAPSWTTPASTSCAS